MELKNLSKKQKIIGMAILAGVLLIAIYYNSSAFSSKNNNQKSPDTIKTDGKDSVDTDNFYVEITGQVESPGVYEVSRKPMVIELIELAGGLTEHADLQIVHKSIPLSTIVEDRQKIYIPGSFEDQGGTAASGDTVSGKININTATEAQLDTLPNIGPATASKIINGRPYGSLEELKNLEGIGEKTYNNIASLITL